MPEETLIEAAHRMCAMYALGRERCRGCPLELYGTCASATVMPDTYPEQCKIVAEWQNMHPLKESNDDRP